MKLCFACLLYRDARNSSRASKVKREIALLDLICGELEIATPKPLYAAPDYSYFGYSYFPGEALERHPEIYRSNAQQRQTFTQLLANASARVAQLATVEKGKAIGLEIFSGIPGQLKNVEYVVHNKLLSPAAIELAEWCLDTYQARYDQALPRAIVMNADFGPSNTLIDNGRISAIVDWTDACIAPVERELAYFSLGES